MTAQPRGFFSPRSHVEDLLRDVRHVSRGLRRTPGFAIAVILTLALGIGGNTAIFSVVDERFSSDRDESLRTLFVASAVRSALPVQRGRP
jgi:hypothetical protein